MHSSRYCHHFMANRWGNSRDSDRPYSGGLQNHCRWWLQPWNKKTLTPCKKSYDQPRQHIKKQRHYFVNKGPSSQSYGFSSGHVRMWELDYKESWAQTNWCFWTVVLEKTVESPLDCKEIQPVHSKGDQSWIFTGRTDAEVETPILWPADAKNLITGINPDAGKDWRREEKGTTEDEMVGWHHRMGMSLSKFWELVTDGEAWHTAIHGVAKSRTWLSDWTELIGYIEEEEFWVSNWLDIKDSWEFKSKILKGTMGYEHKVGSTISMVLNPLSFKC